MPRSPERVHGPYWYSRIAAFFGLRRFCYPERFADWESRGLIPAKFRETLEYNQRLNLCCRHPDNATAAVYKTDPRLPHPDLFVSECSCGRKHYRFRADPVRYNEPEEDRFANATSILDHPIESGVNYG